MIQRILTTKESRLREKTKPVVKTDKKVLQVIRDLEETLKAQKDPEGVGIAAPQIGIPLKLFVINHKGDHLVVCNPEVLKKSKKTNDPSTPPRQARDRSGQVPKDDTNEYIMEGCLSLPHYYGPVQRSWEITLRYQTPKLLATGYWILDTKTDRFSGFLAQIIQHEVDHLHGKVFIDRLLEQKRLLYKLNKKGEWEDVDLTP